jgi:polyisoprenoid-binding protein YceI
MKRMFVAGVVAALVVVGGVVVWAIYLRDDAPAAFELSETDDGTGEGSQATEQIGLDGTWTVAEGSEAGYRVVEDLGEVLDLEAVGRTSEVIGSLEISGSTVTSASFEVDVASISSDDSRRDTQFRDRIMNASEFPTATLTLTEPVDLGALPSEEETVSTTVPAELTLRGVTNAVTVPIDAQLVGDQIEIVGSIDVLFSDYGIANPSNPLVEVRDEGKVEVQLFLSAS